MRVKVISQVIPVSFLKIEGGRLLRQKTGKREEQLVKLISDQNSGPEASPGSKRGGSKRDVRRGATAKGVMEKSRYVRFIEEEEVRRDDPIKYFLPMGVRSTF